MTIGIKRLVLDVLKPLEGPSLTDLSRILSSVEGVQGVNISLMEIDKQTENIKITIEGSAIDEPAILTELEKHGAVVHSIDEVASGNKMVDAVETPQD